MDNGTIARVSLSCDWNILMHANCSALPIDKKQQQQSTNSNETYNKSCYICVTIAQNVQLHAEQPKHWKLIYSNIELRKIRL